MQEERLIKTHLIVNDITNRYHINWFGKLAATDPELQNGLPIFVIISGSSRVELNTIDISQIEDCAKRLTAPKGKTAITSDSAHIYIKERNGNETHICTVTHKRVKSFSPMYDRVGWR